MKKLIGLAFMLILCCLMTTNAYSESEININLDGENIILDSDSVPFIDSNDRTLVPLRGVMEKFGAKVTWDEESRIAIVEKDDVKVEVPIGEKYILKNGTKMENDTVALIKDGRTYLPIRIVLESFGAGVGWNQLTKTVIINRDGSDSVVEKSDELRAMWISYLEFAELPKSESDFKSSIDKMFNRCVELGMNSVIVQVRPDSDAMYPSDYYPWSKFASGKQGLNPGYDPLKYMIDAAHERNLEFHAWINPYRVTGYSMDWNEVSDDNPAKIWLTDNVTYNDRWVLLHNGYYYYNPSISQVRELVVNGVSEIVKNYDVDGIHFDDYFYPSLDDNDVNKCFDKGEYQLCSSTSSITEWRRNNVNELVKAVYKEIKSQKPDVIFGISPAGYVNNLLSDNSHFVDINTWMSNDGYVDYIMPQLYWGFERKDYSGNPAAYAYENNLNTWVNLKKKGNVSLYIGLNMANAGSDIWDGNSVSEWLRYNDIIKRQVIAARNTNEVSGFAFFRYDYFNHDTTQNEVNNLTSILKSN
ncbi:family 10 glycosylhydrolase [Anaerovorax odorimutans]|uniref:family 10 glycosylhydrolase n=1 Tax=Anaerovorax odorimutans TaxID=109327 RepID=UPI000418A126|nr:family 10 glycosylhydrolase [Anaerovorax odorimutans]